MSAIITDDYVSESSVNYHRRFYLKTVCENYVSQTVLAVASNIDDHTFKIVCDYYNTDGYGESSVMRRPV